MVTRRGLSARCRWTHTSADHLVVHVDLLDADPRTASVAFDGDVVTVMAAHTSAGRADAWYVQQLALDRSLAPDRLQARVHDGVVTVTLDLRGGGDSSGRSANR
jgi:HSP20 family molecular chaperone IbpA